MGWQRQPYRGVVCVSLGWSEGQVAAIKMQNLDTPELRGTSHKANPFSGLCSGWQEMQEASGAAEGAV